MRTLLRGGMEKVFLTPFALRAQNALKIVYVVQKIHQAGTQEGPQAAFSTKKCFFKFRALARPDHLHGRS